MTHTKLTLAAVALTTVAGFAGYSAGAGSSTSTPSTTTRTVTAAPVTTTVTAPPVTTTRTVSAGAPSCLLAMADYRTMLGIVSDFSTTMVAYPGLVGDAAKAGAYNDSAGLMDVATSIRGITVKVKAETARMQAINPAHVQACLKEAAKG